MSRKARSLLIAGAGLTAGVLGLVLLLPMAVSPHRAPPQRTAPQPTGDHDAAALGTAATSADELSTTLSDMGRRSISWNVIYVEDDGDVDVDTMDAAAERGVVHQVVTVEFWSLEHEQGVLRAIADGAVDQNLRRIARQLRAWQHRHPEAEVIVRPLHEANLGSYPWGFGEGNVNDNHQEDFAPAWDRIWTVMRAQFPALRFFLCPNGWGDSYDWGVPAGEIDYIGNDNYNWSQTSGDWVPPDVLLDGTITEIRKLYPDKPYVIGEVGTSEPGPGLTGHSKAEWFRQLAAWMKGPAVDLGVVAVCYFDHGGRNDWRIYPRGEPGAQESRDAFQRAFAIIP